MKKNIIAVYGGSFNPPTLAHIDIIRKLSENKKVDKVIVVPVGDMYIKDELINSNNRLEMLKSINLNSVVISDIEIQASTLLTTIDTLSLLQKEYSNHIVRFVVGADNLLDIENWNNSKEILRDFGLIALSRTGLNVPEIIKDSPFLNKYKENIVHMEIDTKYSHISSTKVRELIANKEYKEIEKSLSSSVIEYIKSNNLYFK